MLSRCPGWKRRARRGVLCRLAPVRSRGLMWSASTYQRRPCFRRSSRCVRVVPSWALVSLRSVFRRHRVLSERCGGAALRAVHFRCPPNLSTTQTPISAALLLECEAIVDDNIQGLDVLSDRSVAGVSSDGQPAPLDTSTRDAPRRTEPIQARNCSCPARGMLFALIPSPLREGLHRGDAPSRAIASRCPRARNE
jgi:hypothetical protein